MLFNGGLGEDSWESLVLIQLVHPKGNQFWIFIGKTGAKAKAPIVWPPDVKNWLNWKRSWCCGRLKEGGKGEDRGWNGWMASPTQWTWVWVNSGSWWWTGKPGMLWSVGLQTVGHDWAEGGIYVLFVSVPDQEVLFGRKQKEIGFWKSKFWSVGKVARTSFILHTLLECVCPTPLRSGESPHLRLVVALWQWWLSAVVLTLC